MHDIISKVLSKSYFILLPASYFAFALLLLTLIPLACFRQSRRVGGFGILVSSYLFGLTTWVLAALTTLNIFGLKVAIISVMFFGVGVLPVAMYAAFFKMDSNWLGWTLAAMLLLVIVTRVAGRLLIDSLNTPRPVIKTFE